MRLSASLAKSSTQPNTRRRSTTSWTLKSRRRQWKKQFQLLPAVASAPVAVDAPVAAAPLAGGAAALAYEPVKAVDTLRVTIAQKLKKAVDEVPLYKTAKVLVGGKSTLQTEILGDLQAEFTSVPKKGEELPVDELGSPLSIGYSGSLGKTALAWPRA